MSAAEDQARALLDVGRLDRAASTLRTALAADPDDAGLLTLLAFTLRRQGKPAEALEACRAALTAGPHRPEAHIEHAESLLSVLRFDDALTAAEQAVRLAPNWSAAYRMLAQTLLVADRHPEAQQAAAHAVTLEPQSASALVMVANVARRNGRHDDAERAVRAALAIDPADHDARWLRAMMDAERLRTRRSLWMLRGLARENPADPDPLSMTWPIRHLLGTLKTWLAVAVVLTCATAIVAVWWPPAAPASRMLAAVSATATLAYALLLLAPAGRTPWHCLELLHPLMRRAAHAAMVMAGVQVTLLIVYGLTAAWWLPLLALAAAPVLWLLEAGMTMGAGLGDPGARHALEELLGEFRQWWQETKRDLAATWREGGR